MHVHTPIKGKINALYSALPPLLFVSFFINLLALTSPIYMIQLYDRVLSSLRTETLIVITALAGLALAVFGLLEAVRGWMLNRLGCWVEAESTGDIVRKTIEAKLNDDLRGARFLNDIGEIRNFILSSLKTLLDLPFSPIFFIAAFLIHPLIGWMTLASAIILFAVAVINDRTTRKAARRYAEELVDGQRMIDHGLRNAETVRAMHMDQFLIDRWQHHLTSAQTDQVRASDMAATFTGLTKFIRMFAQALILGAGAFLVIGGQISVGLIIAGSIILGRALAPIDQSLQSWRSLNQARQAYRRLIELDETYNLIDDRPRTHQLKPEGFLVLENVQYTDKNSQARILKNISFSIEPGEVAAIVGPSGAGKSTIAKVLVGVRKPSGGIATLDGIDLANWDRQLLGTHIGYLPQSIELFAGTIAENIARMATDVPIDKVKAAVEVTGIQDLINKLPNGLETRIAHGGGFLSGGQRQRIGLARAFFDDPSIIVLDEPNAHLDVDGEKALIEAIKSAQQRKCSIILACHTPSLLAVADTILVVIDGDAQVFGPADQVRPALIAGLEKHGERLVPKH